jgi:hypothetical protein
MIYPATYDITILQNATWRGSFRATQNRQALTSITIAGTTPTFNVPCHGLTANTKVVFTGGDDIPCGLTLNTVYYVIAAGLTTGAFQVSATSGGSTISVTGTASGDFYVATPLDITGYTVDADVKGLITNTLVGTFTPTITSATEGAFELMMLPATSLAIEVGSYGWDVSLTQSGGERYYWVTGVATVQRTYSRT